MCSTTLISENRRAISLQISSAGRTVAVETSAAVAWAVHLIVALMLRFALTSKASVASRIALHHNIGCPFVFLRLGNYSMSRCAASIDCLSHLANELIRIGDTAKHNPDGLNRKRSSDIECIS